MTILVLSPCVQFAIWHRGYAETIFADGRVAQADLTVDDESARRLAQELGYGTDVHRMHLEHELSHSLIANPLPSKALRYAAGDPTVTRQQAGAEEGEVLAFQRWAMTGQAERALPLVDPDRTKQQLHRLCDTFYQIVRSEP